MLILLSTSHLCWKAVVFLFKKKMLYIDRNEPIYFPLLLVHFIVRDRRDNLKKALLLSTTQTSSWGEKILWCFFIFWCVDVFCALLLLLNFGFICSLASEICQYITNVCQNYLIDYFRFDSHFLTERTKMTWCSIKITLNSM